MKVTTSQKRSALKMLASGKATRTELAKKYNVDPSTVSKWKKSMDYKAIVESTPASKSTRSKRKTTSSRSTKSTTPKTNSYKQAYESFKSDFNLLKKAIKSLYRASINSKI